MDKTTFLKRLSQFLIISMGALIALVLIENAASFTGLADALAFIRR